ncbi:MAG: hypothetical protein ACE5DI_02220 [Candidatus Micrarchaeia archaeon]
MAHKVGDAPKIPFLKARNDLRTLHRRLLEENPVKTRKQAEKAASILERHLEKWKKTKMPLPYLTG